MKNEDFYGGRTGPLQCEVQRMRSCSGTVSFTAIGGFGLFCSALPVRSAYILG